MDPSGLARVSFYDPDDKLPCYDEGGNLTDYYVVDGFQEYADDVDYLHYILPMTCASDVLGALWRLKKMGEDVTEVYFYDHCESSWADKEHTQHRVEGLQFRADSLSFGGEDSGLAKLGRDVSGILGNGVTYHFRHCLLGTDNNKDRLMDLAKWFNGSATGVNGWIVPGNVVPHPTVSDPDPVTGQNHALMVQEAWGPDYMPKQAA